MKSLALFLSLTTALAINESAIGAAGAGARAAADGTRAAVPLAANANARAVSDDYVARLGAITGVFAKKLKECLEEIAPENRERFVTEVEYIQDTANIDSRLWPELLGAIREIGVGGFDKLNAYVIAISDTCEYLSQEPPRLYGRLNVEERPNSYVIRELIENFSRLNNSGRLNNTYGAIQKMYGELYAPGTPRNACFPYFAGFLLKGNSLNLYDFHYTKRPLEILFENLLCDFAKSFEKYVSDGLPHIEDSDSHAMELYFKELEKIAARNASDFPGLRGDTPETNTLVSAFIDRCFTKKRNDKGTPLYDCIKELGQNSLRASFMESPRMPQAGGAPLGALTTNSATTNAAAGAASSAS